MKTLIIYLGRKGAGPVYSFELARYLSNKVSVVALLSQSVENAQRWKLAEFPVYFIPTYSGLISAGLPLFDIRQFRCIRKIVVQEKPNVVHYPMLHPWVPLLNFTVFSTLPKVVTVHDPRPHRGEENWLLFKLHNVAVRQAKMVIVHTESSRKIMTAMGIPENKINVIPHGEFSYYSRLSGNMNNTCSKKDSTTLLFFGRIRKYKGFDILLRAFQLVLKEIPEARLLVVGSGDLSPYRNIIASLPNIDVINRWVSEEEVANFFQRASVLVAPYIDASQSGVISIAFSMRVPVIASDVGGLGEMVKDGVTGLLVPPGDPVSLARQCINLLRNVELRTKLSEGAQKVVETIMNWDHIAELTIETYLKAI